jgi:Na+-driven multidrug efflux pump
VFTWLFIAVLNYGVVGAALATVLANALITPFILYDLFFSKKHLTISLKDMWPDKASLKDVFTFAFPAAFGQSMTAFGFIIIQSLILSYGVAVSSGFSVAARITMLLLYPVVALGQVNATYIGMNIGHKQPERAKKSFQLMRKLSVSMMIIGVLIVLPFRQYAIAFILGTNISESFRIGSEFVFWLLMTQPFMAMFQTFMSLYNGVGMSRYTMILSLIRLWGLRIPLIFIYMLLFSNEGYEGIYIAMMISNIVIIPVGLYFESKINFDIKVRLDA